MIGAMLLRRSMSLKRVSVVVFVEELLLRSKTGEWSRLFAVEVAALALLCCKYLAKPWCCLLGW